MKTPPIKPRGKWIFVKPDGEESRVSKHGLITPSTVEAEKKSIGTVLEIGSDVVGLKKGMRVIFGTYAGEQLQIEKVDYKLLHDDDVIAIYE